MLLTSGWIGPYDGQSVSQTETLSIGSNSDPPYYPDHPRKIDSATGGFLNQNFITCGGYDSDEGVTDKCYLLGSEEPFATMMTKRRNAASIVLDEKLWILEGSSRSIVLEPGKLWILGGSDENNNILSSTEYIFADGKNEEGPPMPIALDRHVMVKINGTTSLLVGGWMGNSANNQKSWYYNDKWHIGPNLPKARNGHSVGIVRDSVTTQDYLVVTGGYNGSFQFNDVEILSVTGNAWETGKFL